MTQQVVGAGFFTGKRVTRGLASLLLIPALLIGTAQARDVTPAVKTFWQTCLPKAGDAKESDFYRVRYFGSNPTMARQLLNHIANSDKTVTFTTPWVFEGDRNATPIVGGYTVATDFEGNPEVLLRTTKLKNVAYSEVTEEDSQFEGPGARTLEAWKTIHWRFFTNALKPFGKQPSEDMPIVVEHFEVVCKVDGTEK